MIGESDLDSNGQKSNIALNGDLTVYTEQSFNEHIEFQEGSYI